MVSDNDEDTKRESDKLRVEVLAKGFERYQLMSHVFFRRLDNKEKIDALLEVATIIREEGKDD